MMDYGKTKRTATMLWELLRIKNCLVAFFGVVVGATFVFTSDIPMNWISVLIAGFAAFLITGAGNALNDYFDFEIDKINKPGRPIPSGRISKSDTLMLSTVLFLVGLGFSKFVNDYCLVIAAISSVILILYGMHSKKMLLVSNLGISFLVALIFVFGVAATVQADVGFVWVEEMNLVVIITLCAFLVTLSREIIKDIEDIKGDMRKYAVTLPIKIGVDRSKQIAMVFTLLAILLSFTPFFMSVGVFNLYAYAFILSIADVVFIVSLTMHPALSQRMMVLGMGFALLAFFLGNIL